MQTHVKRMYVDTLMRVYSVTIIVANFPLRYTHVFLAERRVS